VADRLSPCRQQIIDFLTVNGETCLTVLTERLGRSKNNVCHDLKVLLGWGYVTRRYEGQESLYAVTPEAVSR
jgi:DNA-binding transcriptional ArsR family regulator